MMVDMTTAFCIEYTLADIICITIAMIIISKLTSDVGSKMEIRSFRHFLSAYIVFSATNAVWVWRNSRLIESVAPGVVLSLANMTALCVCGYFWFEYSLLRLDPRDWESPVLRGIIRVMTVAMVVLIISSLKTRWIFYYTMDDGFQHGPLYMLQLVEIAYLLIPVIYAIYHSSNTQSRERKHECYMMIYCLLPPAIGALIDAFIPNLPIIELATLFAIYLVFSDMMESQIYNDALTGLNNRRQGEEWLKSKMMAASKDDPLYFFISDVDAFKDINDTFGHLEGDRALMTIADALRAVGSKYRGMVARWGGDEFSVIINAHQFPSPGALMDAINKKVDEEVLRNKLEYDLNLTFGYAVCDSPSTDIEEILLQADKMMYREKEKSRSIDS